MAFSWTFVKNPDHFFRNLIHSGHLLTKMSNVLLAALLLASTQGISDQISNFKILKKKKGICGVKVSFFVAKGLFQVFLGGFSDLKLR